MVKDAVSEYLSEIGTKGGKSKSEAKVAAVRANGKAGGRPVIYPPCPGRKRHRFKGNQCACGFVRASS